MVDPRKVLFMFCGLAFLAICPLPAQDAVQSDLDEVKKDIETLKQGQQQIRQQLGQILRLLQQQARPAPARPAVPEVVGKIFELGSNPFVGESTAPLTLIEFTDYQ